MEVNGVTILTIINYLPLYILIYILINNIHETIYLSRLPVVFENNSDWSTELYCKPP